MGGDGSRPDWAAPWYAPWRLAGESAMARMRAGESAAAALQASHVSGGAPVAFVSQSALPEGMPYERFIFETRQVPTREGLHDFFNGLCWQQFPRAKSRLNALQAAEIARDGVGAVRGPVRDAVTVFDENGALLHAPPPLWEALLARQWYRLFVELRPLWGQARLVIFGHAMLEKLVTPRKDMTAHVWRANMPGVDGWPVGLEGVDAWLADALSPEALAAKPFTPLPVLGVPGWWSANENSVFYDDERVFRQPRPPRSA